MSSHRSPSQRRELVTAFRRSGLSQREFAEREGIKVTTLQSWLYHPSERKDAAVPSPGFVRVEGEADGSGVRIEVGGAVVVHLLTLPEPEYIARLVRALAC
jgi:hypothetical protein